MGLEKSPVERPAGFAVAAPCSIGMAAAFPTSRTPYLRRDNEAPVGFTMLTGAWTGRPIMNSWRAPPRATNGLSGMLARRHAAGAHRLARRMLGSEALAEEIVQDALLRVWINAPRWRPEAAFRTWLYRIVVNLCLNAKRRSPDLPLAAAGDPRRSRARRRSGTRTARARPRLAAAIAALPDTPARRDRTHLSGGARQRGGRRRARHVGFRHRDHAGPRQAAHCARRSDD